MKQSLKLYPFVCLLIFIASCEMTETDLAPEPTPVADNYSNIKDFHNQNSVPLQIFSINASTGGVITGSQGTTINIPPNAFVSLTGTLITGTVSIEIKEIYKKSDMLLSDKPTVAWGGALPLKSSGEFYIRVKSGNAIVQIAPGKQIDAIMPAGNDSVDNNMNAFIAGNDSILAPMGNFNWVQQVIFAGGVAQVQPNPTLSNYVFSLYQFTCGNNGQPDSGTWCNSDNPTYFQSSPQTQLTIHANDNPFTFGTDVFLIFKNVKSMVHVYQGQSNNFPYLYSPLNYKCTIVAVGVKEGKVYSAFVPITITNNLNVNFSLTETTTEQFKTSLNALN